MAGLACLPCAPGTHQPATNHDMTSCPACAPGTFSPPGAATCTTCPEGESKGRVQWARELDKEKGQNFLTLLLAWQVSTAGAVQRCAACAPTVSHRRTEPRVRPAPPATTPRPTRLCVFLARLDNSRRTLEPYCACHAQLASINLPQRRLSAKSAHQGRANPIWLR